MKLFYRASCTMIAGLLAVCTALPASAEAAAKVPDIAPVDPVEVIALEPVDTPTPDFITSDGRRAINEYYGIGPQPVSDTDSSTLGLPALDDILSIRLFDQGKLYLIDDPTQIARIWQAMEATKATPITSRTEVTGYDAADYPKEFQLELVSRGSSGHNQVQSWCTISNSDRFLIRINNQADLAYDDLPFVTEHLSTLTEVLKELSSNQSAQSSVLSLVSDRPQICRVDEKGLFFTSTDDLTNADADKLYLSYHQANPYRRQYTGGDSKVLYRLSGDGEQLYLQPAEMGAKIYLDQQDYQDDIFYFYGMDDGFLSQLDSSLTDLPAHPLWFYPILSGQRFTVLDSAPSELSQPPVTVANLASTELLRPLLTSLCVQKDNIQKVDKNYFLKNPLTFYLQIADNNYTVSINDSALLLRGQTEGYGLLYQLVDGKETRAAIQEAVKLTQIKRYAAAYTQMLLQLIEDEPGYFRKIKEVTIHFQSTDLPEPALSYLCSLMEDNLSKKGYNFSLYAGSLQQLEESGKWTKPEGSDIAYYRDGVLIQIDDHWQDNTITYSIGAQTNGQDAVYYMENTAEYQKGTWVITPSKLIAIS